MVPAEVGTEVIEISRDEYEELCTCKDKVDILQAKHEKDLAEISRLKHIIRRAGNELDEAYS